MLRGVLKHLMQFQPNMALCEWTSVKCTIYCMLIHYSAFFFSSIRTDLILCPPPPLPTLSHTFCRDCICLQTCLRQWVVWAGGSWQERPQWLQLVALELPATNTWTSSAPTQSPRATNTWKAAALPSLPWWRGCFLTHIMSTTITLPAFTTCQLSQPGVKI